MTARKKRVDLDPSGYSLRFPDNILIFMIKIAKGDRSALLLAPAQLANRSHSRTRQKSVGPDLKSFYSFRGIGMKFAGMNTGH